MRTSLPGDVMRVIAVMMATLCGTITPAGAELSGSGHAILDVDRFSMETSPGRSGTRKDAASRLLTSSEAGSARARLQARTRGSSRFELGIELHVPAPGRYHEPVDDAAEAGGLLAMSGPGTLSIQADALGLVPGASVRVTETGTNFEMLLELGPQQTMLELQLEPGTYRILIEGTLDAEEIDREHPQGRNVPTPGAIPVLALLVGSARGRRR